MACGIGFDPRCRSINHRGVDLGLLFITDHPDGCRNYPRICKAPRVNQVARKLGQPAGLRVKIKTGSNDLVIPSFSRFRRAASSCGEIQCSPQGWWRRGQGFNFWIVVRPSFPLDKLRQLRDVRERPLGKIMCAGLRKVHRAAPGHSEPIRLAGAQGGWSCVDYPWLQSC